MFSSLKDRISVSLAVVALLAMPLAAAAQSKTQADRKIVNQVPMLFTEKGEFAGDEKIRLRGQQFAAGEVVGILIELVEPGSGYRTLVDNKVAVTDAFGNLYAEFELTEKGGYQITATGSESRESAVKMISSSGDSLVPTPIVVAGNPSCQDLDANNASFPTIVAPYGFKLDFGNPNGNFPLINNGSGTFPTVLTGGSFPDASKSVNATTVNGGREFSWSSDRPISAVIIKGGANANVYVYDPESFGDTGPLTSPNPNQAISHVEFCTPETATIVIVKQASPPSNYQFDFSATNMATSNFGLVDNSSSTNPSQTFLTSLGTKTITEINPGFYSLVNISCTVGGLNQNSTFQIDIANRRVDINLADDDIVTCTFVNDFVTAASVSVEGRVLDPYGKALRGAIVSVTDVQGNTRSARTNNFGYYRIEGLEAGGAFSVNASYKGLTFANQLRTLDGDVNRIDLIAAPR